MRAFLVLLAIACTCLLAPIASAQERALLSGVDFTFGVGRGLGGPRANDRNLPSFGITAAVPVLKRDRGMIVAALHGSCNGAFLSVLSAGVGIRAHGDASPLKR